MAIEIFLNIWYNFYTDYYYSQECLINDRNK